MVYTPTVISRQIPCPSYATSGDLFIQFQACICYNQTEDPPFGKNCVCSNRNHLSQPEAVAMQLGRNSWCMAEGQTANWACGFPPKDGSVVLMDEIQFAPPKTPWNDVNTNKQNDFPSFSSVQDFAHPQYVCSLLLIGFYSFLRESKGPKKDRPISFLRLSLQVGSNLNSPFAGQTRHLKRWDASGLLVSPANARFRHVRWPPCRDRGVSGTSPQPSKA